MRDSVSRFSFTNCSCCARDAFFWSTCITIRMRATHPRTRTCKTESARKTRTIYFPLPVVLSNILRPITNPNTATPRTTTRPATTATSVTSVTIASIQFSVGEESRLRRLSHALISLEPTTMARRGQMAKNNCARMDGTGTTAHGKYPDGRSTTKLS